MSDKSSNDIPTIISEKKNNKKKIIIGLVIVILATSGITLGVSNGLSMFDPKQTLNLVQEPVIQKNQIQIQTLNSTTSRTQIVTTSLEGNNTVVTLANGDKFVAKSNQFTVGQNIEITKEIYKPICTLTLYDSQNKTIQDVFDKLSSNQFTINGIRNQLCDTNKTFTQITNLKLVP